MGTRAGTGRPAAIDEHHRPANKYAARVDVDKVAADFERQSSTGFNYQIHTGLQVDFHARLKGIVHTGFFLVILTGI